MFRTGSGPPPVPAAPGRRLRAPALPVGADAAGGGRLRPHGRRGRRARMLWQCRGCGSLDMPSIERRFDEHTFLVSVDRISLALNDFSPSRPPSPSDGFFCPAEFVCASLRSLPQDIFEKSPEVRPCSCLREIGETFVQPTKSGITLEDFAPIRLPCLS